ncbi:pilus assembly protein PilY [Acinetobacter sp. NIPH 1852]|uniref:PilC/PilY family type IV pilus protein n=1 Tax=Acinetobacter sp. NIPH 1852 TaxID=2923428 RepID=UPI001F4BB6FF|nr:PilC/PilY family type IV pilus protein [Acinetobacter sp. NIPH 1852]MCH7309533.1 pilus assembly protein PilY [Acinetobacter sp. NIPH 1852]
MKRQKNRLDFQHYVHRFSYGASFVWAFTGTMLVATSVAQASDMQIYANPTAGKKTIVMMLDTSGSMNYIRNDYDVCTNDTTFNGSKTTPTTDNTVYREDSTTTPSYERRYCYVRKSQERDVPAKVKDPNTGCEKVNDTTYKCYDRITRLKDGMNALLESNNAILKNVRVGLGHYPLGNVRGKILVTAEPLGDVNTLNTSGSQRYKLRQAVNDLIATGRTPTAHAYAEAAAYLMGTSTRSASEIQKDLYKKVTNRSVTTYYKCVNWRSTDFSNGVQYCANNNTNRNGTNATYWQNMGNVEPSDFAGDGASGDFTYTLEMQLGTNADSGFDDSITASKDGNNYISPLPAAADRVSCDGQGVYVLSDGEANNSSVARSRAIMSAALETTTTNFTCPTSGGLDTGAAASWHCMGEFAKKLFNKNTNPVSVSIQTAFVGFGNDFNALTATHVQQACKMSSRTQADRSGNDACSPGAGTHAVSTPGYGNGGFFTTQSAQGVTDSVIAFINNLGVAPLEPLTTGSISVPSDALSPSGLQPYGYLRALEPNPQSNNMIWAGNLKRYKVVLSGANAGAFAGANGTTLVYDSKGAFNKTTKDLWNSSAVYDGKSYTDGGIINLGGALSRVPMPILGQAENLSVEPKQYAYAARPNALRRLFTNVTVNGGADLTSKDDSGDLLSIPVGDAEGEIPTTGIAAYVLKQFTEQNTLKDFPILVKQKILNYLGFSVPLDESATDLPATLTTPNAPHLAMGGSVHSFPVQLTYSGTLDATGQLTSTREQSILYGTMDGGLHLVDSTTGMEQMVFVPSELLRSNIASKALVKGASDNTAPVHGVDGEWVADALYKSQKATNATDVSKVQARQMNVYGGLRMGGESYYGLDVLNPKKPKLLFRVGSDQSNYSRMGQSWSKPIIANIRHNNVIKRVMIVGGGYDARYESPTFTLTGSDTAKGNAVYIIDAKTGERLWWASNTGANTNNTNMKHSIVSRVSAIDRNADGLIDHLYFGDLGGQVFRADLNNAVGTTTANFGKRVVRLANLATTESGAALDQGKNPRFYKAPTVTIHDQGAETFMLIGLASGNRSTPLDVYPLRGRDGMTPVNALNDRLVNNVYGLIDRDFIKTDLISGTPTLSTENKNLSHLQKNPQLLTGNIIGAFVGASATKDGWYRSLSSNSNGIERADNSFRVAGGMKAFEEPIALTGNLIVPVYDPQGTGIAQQDPCKPRVIGETDSQRFCLPYGVCLKSDGTVNLAREGGTGFQTTTEDCPPNVTECNKNVIGGGIVGLAPVPIKEPTSTNPCPDFSIAGNEKGNGIWNCIPTINPTRWYERWKK